MKFLKTATALSVLPLLAACASQWDVDGAKMAANDGDAFLKELQSEYARLAGLERDEGDWADARLFVGKAMQATQGGLDPQVVAERNIPEDHVSEMTMARKTLMAAFEKGGKTAAPQAAARAQAGYDCWMQEQEENFQPDDIEACKKYFEAGLRDMYAAMEQKPAAPMAKMDDIIVYFGFDSAMLSDEAKAQLDKAAMMSKKADALMISGHTDTSGNAAYNEALALKRASMVADYLKSAGVSARSMRVGASGEKINAVTTGDDVKEARNRRVTVEFK